MKKALVVAVAGFVAMSQFGCTAWLGSGWNIAALNIATILDFFNIAPFS